MRSLATFAPSNRSPVPLVQRRNYGGGSLFGARGGAGYVTQMETYGTDPVIYPMVRRLAEAVGSLEWKLWERAPSGLDEDRKPVLNHPIIDLIEEPNKFMTFGQIVEAGQQHSDLTGETNIVVGKLPGVKFPLDLWPIRPDRLEPVPDPYEFLKGWVYQIGNDKVPLENDELLRAILPSPLDPYRGMGPIQALMRELDAQRYGKEWQSQFFQNSARPGGIIEIPTRLGGTQFDEMRMRWSEQHKGLSKAHRVAILENGAKWVETAFSLRDLQMAEMEAVGTDKKLIAFGFPKAVLGIVEDVNRANAEAGEYLFAKWLVLPRARRWRSMLNQQLLPMFGKDVRRKYVLDFEDPVPENSEQGLNEIDVKVQAYIDLVAAGADEKVAAEYLGLPSLGIEKPEPPAPPALPPPPTPGQDPEQDPEAPEARHPGIDVAMRWQVEAKSDDSICEPCKKNDGKLYRNRQSAYADYPGGKGYIKCVGAQYGNECRCSVKKRRK